MYAINIKISTLLKPDLDVNSLSKTGLTLKNSINEWVTLTEINEFQQEILTMVISGKPANIRSSLGLSSPAPKAKVAAAADDDISSGSLTQILHLNNDSVSESGTQIVHSRSASDSVVIHTNFDESSLTPFFDGTDADHKQSGHSVFATTGNHPDPTLTDQALVKKLIALEEQNAKLLQMIQQQKDAYLAEVKQLKEELHKIRNAQQLKEEKPHNKNITLKTAEAINSQTSEAIPMPNSLPASRGFTTIMALLSEISAMPILNPHVDLTVHIANNLDSSTASPPVMLTSFEAGRSVNNGTGSGISITASASKTHRKTPSNTF